MNPVRGLVRGVTRGTKGVVNRVLQGLHTLHTFFGEKGRGAPRDFFFFFLEEKKKISTHPWDFAPRRGAQTLQSVQPQAHLAPKPQGAHGEPPSRGPAAAPTRRACARPARARVRAGVRVGDKVRVRLGLQTVPNPKP